MYVLAILYPLYVIRNLSRVRTLFITPVRNFRRTYVFFISNDDKIDKFFSPDNIYIYSV